MKGYQKMTAVTVAVLAVGCSSVETESWQNCAIAGGLVGGAAGAFVEGATEVVVGTVAGTTIVGSLCERAEVQSAGVEPDTDADGVADSRDACPNSLEGAIVDSKGCSIDRDADGVADFKDQCPDSVAGAQVNALGCVNALVLDGVSFHTGSAVLTQSAKGILLPLARSHYQHHSDVSLIISGHTDSQGSDESNQRLSENRAKAVKAFMVTHGCDAEKLATVGYGESKAIADNATQEGRAKNRRVELTIRK